MHEQIQAQTAESTVLKAEKQTQAEGIASLKEENRGQRAEIAALQGEIGSLKASPHPTQDSHAGSSPSSGKPERDNINSQGSQEESGAYNVAERHEAKPNDAEEKMSRYCIKHPRHSWLPKKPDQGQKRPRQQK